MTKTVLVAFAVVSLAPAAAQGATMVVSAQGSDVPADGFDMSRLIDGVDHVLASVDDRTPLVADPLGSGAAAFAAGDVASRHAAPTTRSAAAYSSADAPQEPLPEPATWLMMILGFFGLSFAVRRRSVATGDRVRFS